MTFNSAFVDRSSSSSENNFEVLNFDSDGEFTSVRRNYEISTEGSREFVEGDIRRRLRCGLLNEQDSGHPGSVDRVGEEILQTRSGSSYKRNNINAIIQEALSETQFECEENSEYQEVEESEFSERDYSIDGLPVDTVTREEGEYVPRITAVDLGNWRYRPTVTSVSSVDSSSRTESQDLQLKKMTLIWTDLIESGSNQMPAEDYVKLSFPCFKEFSSKQSFYMKSISYQMEKADFGIFLDMYEKLSLTASASSPNTAITPTSCTTVPTAHTNADASLSRTSHSTTAVHLDDDWFEGLTSQSNTAVVPCTIFQKSRDKLVTCKSAGNNSHTHILKIDIMPYSECARTSAIRQALFDFFQVHTDLVVNFLD